MSVFLLALLACTPSSDDLDGDGYIAGVGPEADCDDTLAWVHPGADERCDAMDEDCDGEVDEDAVDALSCFRDADGDGHGDPAVVETVCVCPPGYVVEGDDCDDTRADVHPGAAESCDGVDDDCDGLEDESGGQIWWEDADGDGWGNPVAGRIACGGEGLAPRAGDCDDRDASVHPEADELCDGEDQDCDGLIDEDPVDGVRWYADLDEDGWGDPSASLRSCGEPEQMVTEPGDCDDLNSSIHPGALEVCNGVDDDCDGVADGSDAWWDTGWPYRIPLEITGASADLDAAPIFVDVDLEEAVAELGLSVVPSMDSVRVILQDCTLGQPLLPAQSVDGWIDRFGTASDSGDGEGMWALRYDEDGDLSTEEPLEAGATVSAALYFGTSGSAAGWSSDAQGSASSLDTGVTTARFARDGSLEQLSTTAGGDTSASLADQSSVGGNGAWTSSWDSGREGTTSVLASGPVLVALRGEGTRVDADGAMAWSTTWWGMAGRPELWVRAQLVTTDTTTLSWPDDAAEGVCPWASSSDALDGATASDDSSLEWADLSAEGWGLAWGYSQAPTYLVDLVDEGGTIRSLASDALSAGAGSPVEVSAGTTLYDAVMVVWPHEGEYADIADAFQAAREGVEVVLGDPEAL